MQVTLMDKARIEREWPLLADILLPAVRQSPNASLHHLRDRLMSHSALLFEVSGGAHGFWAVTVADDDGELVAWTYAIAGMIEGGPKHRLAVMREAIGAIERVAAMAGCKAHRIAGRDYSRFFPDYQPIDGAHNGLEKRF